MLLPDSDLCVCMCVCVCVCVCVCIDKKGGIEREKDGEIRPVFKIVNIKNV